MTREVFHRGIREGEYGTLQPNSFEAVLKAHPGDRLEMDVFEMSDGQLGIAHNKDLNLTLEQAGALDVKKFEQMDQPQKGGEPTPGIKMPLFDEVAGQASDRDVQLILELKSESDVKIIKLVETIVGKMEAMLEQGAFKQNPDFLKKNLFFHTFSIAGAQKMAELLRQHGLDAVSVSLAWPTSEQYANDMAITRPDIEWARTVPETPDWIEKGILIAKRIGCRGIGTHIKAVLANPAYIQKAHEQGLWIAVGGIEDERIKRQMEELGVDMYFSETAGLT